MSPSACRRWPARSLSPPSAFFFNDTATTEIYTLSLHDALPICCGSARRCWVWITPTQQPARSEEHTSELQSLRHLVCRLLLEKKKKRQRWRSIPRWALGDRERPQLPSPP